MIYPSIDKLINKVGSKYLLANVVAKRSKEMTKHQHYQMEPKEYKTLSSIGKTLEEISNDLVHIEK